MIIGLDKTGMTYVHYLYYPEGLIPAATATLGSGVPGPAVNGSYPSGAGVFDLPPFFNPPRMLPLSSWAGSKPLFHGIWFPYL